MLAVHNTLHAPPTPPYTSTFLSRTTTTTTTLPPITHLDRQLNAMQPLTPPEDPQDVDLLPAKPSMPVDTTHPIDWLDFTRSRSAHFIAEKTCEMICYLWHAKPPSTSFDTSLSITSAANAYPSPSNSPPNSALVHTSSPSPATSYHQLVATPAFVSFLQKILETTQVSQSVIVLSLHYIYKLKEKTRLVGPPGSEFRIAVAGLMMANKFLDDNTYTNKTWSEVSGIDLAEVNAMEKEFLDGVRYNLYVDKATYEAWLNLLKGLVMAKERDLLRARERRKHRRRVLGGAMGHGQTHTPSGRMRYYRTFGNGPPCAPPVFSTVQQQQLHQRAAMQPRARSTSPVSKSSLFSQQLPPIQTQPPPPTSQSHVQQPQAQLSYNYNPPSYSYSPSPAPSSLKRSAATAFSPTSATFSQVPTKRSGVSPDVFPSITSSTPQVSLPETAASLPDQTSQAHHQRPGITLQIPQDQRLTPVHSYSPMDGLPLQGFAKMSLGSTASVPSSTTSYITSSSSNSLSSALGPMPGERERERLNEERRQQAQLTTLVQPYAYSVEDQRRGGEPKNLYFYTLACSPLEYTPSGPSQAPSPSHVAQQEDYEMEREAALEREREREQERQRELEAEREREREREKERERERLRKARLRVHRPPPPSTVRYSDYAYMPYVSATGTTGYPAVNGTHASSYVTSRTPALPTCTTSPANLIGQSQSARTSPIATSTFNGRHFDAVRFEVARTQGYAPSTTTHQQTSRSTRAGEEYSQAYSHSHCQVQNYYGQSESVHSRPQPSVHQPHLVNKPQERNPYPHLSPPTPATSTSTSPITFVPLTRNENSTSGSYEATYANGHGSRGFGNPAYQPIVGGNSYSYERSCVSAYTSPAIDSRKYSPQDPGSGLVSTLPPPANPCTSNMSPRSREELAFAQAQAQLQRSRQQQFDSPGVPAAPFANAGPPGVHHMQYYSVPSTTTTTPSDGRSGYSYPGFGGFANGYGSGYGR